MNWSSRLEFRPVVTKDGRKLVTLADARDYLLKHPNEIAAGEVLKAAERPNQFYLHCCKGSALKGCAWPREAGAGG